MTENEVIKKLNMLDEALNFQRYDADECSCALQMAIQALEEIQQYRAIGTIEQLEWCKDASHWKELFKEKLEKYEAIGTIEEFKALKEKRNFVPIANITLNKEDMQEIVDEIIKEIELDIELDIQKIRAKAIDEFAEKLKKLYQAYDIDLCLQDNDHLNYTDSRIALESYIDEIAEQMKAGEENE